VEFVVDDADDLKPRYLVALGHVQAAGLDGVAVDDAGRVGDFLALAHGKRNHFQFLSLDLANVELAVGGVVAHAGVLPALHHLHSSGDAGKTFHAAVVDLHDVPLVLLVICVCCGVRFAAGSPPVFRCYAVGSIGHLLFGQ
jgi:hypothetical protein